MAEPAPTFPGLLPYFTGPSDAGALRKYLNELIQLLNQLIQFIAKVIITGLKAYRSVTANTTVAIGDGVIDVDATSGNITVTYDPALIPFPNLVQVTRINKVDTSANAVFISNGSTIVDQITASASADGYIAGWRDVFGTGTALRSSGVG